MQKIVWPVCKLRSTNHKLYSISLAVQTSREQLAVAEFAQALLVIPKTLAVNAALDSTDLVAKLRAFHNASQTMTERENLKWYHCHVYCNTMVVHCISRTL